MSVECLGLVVQCYPEKSLADWSLAVVLANCADDDGTSIFPSVETMAILARQTERTAQRNLRRMVETGWLEVVAPATNRRPTEYRINPLWIEAAYDAQAKRVRGGKRKQVKVAVAVPRPIEQSRGDTTTPQQSDPLRGDTMTPQAGATLATSRGDIDDTAYIRDPSVTHNPPTPQGGNGGFDALCKAYPRRRVNYNAALDQWEALNPDEALQAIMAREAAVQAAWPEWQAENGKAVPNLSKWILNRGWMASYNPEAPAAQTAANRDQGAPAPRLTPEQLQENKRKAEEHIGALRERLQCKRKGIKA